MINKPLLKHLSLVSDPWQQKKIKHKLLYPCNVKVQIQQGK